MTGQTSRRPRRQKPILQCSTICPASGLMSEYQRALMLLEQASAARAAIEATLCIVLPGLDMVRAALDRPGHCRDDVRRAIMGAFLEIRGPLLGAAPLAATGYGLGRLLADTVWLPGREDPGVLVARFCEDRMTHACRWLDDLAVAFPCRAAAAVQASLRAWAGWVSSRADDLAGPGPVEETVIRALHNQGELWYRLLVGEKDPMQLLSSEDYVAAGERLLQRGLQIARRFVWRWSPVIVLFLGATGSAIWAALTYVPVGTSRFAAILLSAAAAVGLSWRGTGATLGKALDKAQAELWASEVGAATQQAATILPRQL